MPRAQKGQRFGGRTKGTPNKVTQTAKAALEMAFDGIGGVDRLTRWAEANPSDFYPIWAKILPKNLDVTTAGKPLTLDERVQRCAGILAALEARR